MRARARAQFISLGRFSSAAVFFFVGKEKERLESGVWTRLWSLQELYVFYVYKKLTRASFM